MLRQDQETEIRPFYSKDREKAFGKARSFTGKCRNGETICSAELNRMQTLDALNALEIPAVHGISMSLSETALRFARSHGAEKPPHDVDATLDEMQKWFLGSIE